MTFDFKDRVAVITGGSRGIGASVASTLALAGARVAILDVLEGEAERTCAAIVSQGGSAKAFKTDITSMRAVKEGRDEILALARSRTLSTLTALCLPSFPRGSIRSLGLLAL